VSSFSLQLLSHWPTSERDISLSLGELTCECILNLRDLVKMFGVGQP
jgi:hypothetical protein